MSIDSSIFYSESRRFPISLLALEVYSEKSPAAKTDDELMDIVIEVMSRYCGVIRPNDDDFQYFLERLSEVKQEVDKDLEADTPPSINKMSFGTSYIGYMNKLKLDSTIMQMTGYHFENAKVIYCQLDRIDALRLISEYNVEKLETHKVSMEAVLYGMGGEYKGDASKSSSGDSVAIERVHDVRTKEGAAALRKFGF